jgi:2-polyprenyl-6-methoxyphenol hydroxylase-like FAD-dependent oxidoreductase
MTQENGHGAAALGQKPRVLISGASFAGLATAYWMNRLGYAVTRMGLLERIAAHSLKARPMELLDGRGVAVARMPAKADRAEGSMEGYEIERNLLLDMLFDEVKDNVEFIFDDSISGLEESAEEVAVTFASASRRWFSLVIGCDGTHSAVRRICFGEESEFLLFMQNYFALSIVDKLLMEEDTAQMFNVPGKTAMLSAYNHKTDIALCFFSEHEIAYDRRDQDQQKDMIRDHFAGEGWRISELLEEMDRCDNFYFDKLCQIRMASWSKGRVALVWAAPWQSWAPQPWPTLFKSIPVTSGWPFRSTTNASAPPSRRFSPMPSSSGWRW